MLKIGTASLVVAASLLTAACSDTAPACSDTETVDLVLEIARDSLLEQAGAEIANKVDMSLNAIRTTDANETTGAFECAAELEFTGPGGSNSIDITYLSELVDSGDEFYVTVWGL
ncbi:hypothetical protein [Caenispirillum salinarum]|uniref:hypothetical protein n=1 Tax=Caenispirillum salinarum TaxID=859058 RepID=UPI00384F3FEB